MVLRWDLWEVEAQVVDAQAHSVHNLPVSKALYAPMFIGSGIGIGTLGGGNSSIGCIGPFCTRSTSKYIQHSTILCLLVVV